MIYYFVYLPVLCFTASSGQERCSAYTTDIRFSLSAMISVSGIQFFPHLLSWYDVLYPQLPQEILYRYQWCCFWDGLYPVVYQCQKHVGKIGEEHMHPYLLWCPVVYRRCQILHAYRPEAVLNPITFPVEINEFLWVHLIDIGEGLCTVQTYVYVLSSAQQTMYMEKRDIPKTLSIMNTKPHTFLGKRHNTMSWTQLVSSVWENRQHCSTRGLCVTAEFYSIP